MLVMMVISTIIRCGATFCKSTGTIVQRMSIFMSEDGDPFAGGSRTGFEVERAGDRGHGPLLLCSSQIGLPLKRRTERRLPALGGCSVQREVVAGIEVEAV